MWRKFFREMKRMKFGIFDKEDALQHFPNEKNLQIFGYFKPLLIFIGCFVVILGWVKLPQKIKSADQIDFENDEFFFRANPTNSLEFWALRLFDLEKIGITWNNKEIENEVD